MFQELIELLTRYVIAHEKQAEAAMLMATKSGGNLLPQPIGDYAAEHEKVYGITPGLPDGTECTTCKHVSGSDATTATEEEARVLPDWNPMYEQIQGRYGKDKIQILDRSLAYAGITVKASATGAEKHQALLDAAKEDAASMPPLKNEGDSTYNPATETPVEEPAADASAKPEDNSPATIDDVRTLAQEAVKGGMTPTQVQDIFEEIGGSRRLPEIEEQHMPAIHAKLTAAVKKG